MGSPQPTRANRALEAYLYGDDWWKEILNFYIGLSTNPREIISWLADQIEHAQAAQPDRISTVHIQDLLAGIIEAFPGFPPEELAGLIPIPIDYKAILYHLKQRRQKISKRTKV